MQSLAPTLIVGLAIAALVAVLFFRLARRAKQTKVPRLIARGPVNVIYICAICSVQVTHTRRTLAAWDKGSRKFFCDTCHEKWREAQTARGPTGQLPPSVAPEPRAATRGVSVTGYSPSPKNLAPVPYRRRPLSSKVKPGETGSRSMRGLLMLVVVGVLGWFGYWKYQTIAVSAEGVGATVPAKSLVSDFTPVSPTSAAFKCDGRTHCSQMQSCAEATYFATHCPNTEMDGDFDGVPCERQWCN